MSENGDTLPKKVRAGAKIVLVHPEPESEESKQLLEALNQRDDHYAVFSSAKAALVQCEPSVVGAVIVSLKLPAATELGRKLKELAGEETFLPVIAVGSHARIREALHNFNGACDDFVATPLATDEFGFRLAALVSRQRIQADLVQVHAEFVREQERRKTLAALIVHDLRNPLSAIVGNTQLLVEILEDTEDPIVGQCLSDLGELSEKTLSMVAGLLDVEELEDGLLEARCEAVDVHGLVSRMPSFYKTATAARRLNLQVHCPEGLVASFDRQLIARILENLLDNAVRYAPRKGHVVLSVAVEQRDLIFEVGNNGPPIPAEERERMFNRYYRLEASRKGTRSNRGLGLYFCRLAATAHKGSIGVTEHPELPACFVLRLPGCVV